MGLSLLPNLKLEHIHFSKMRVDLAAHVCPYIDTIAPTLVKAAYIYDLSMGKTFLFMHTIIITLWIRRSQTRGDIGGIWEPRDRI